MKYFYKNYIYIATLDMIKEKNKSFENTKVLKDKKMLEKI